MGEYVLHFDAVDKTGLAIVGGKGANLGELYRIPGVVVPDGFCITTRAYRDFVAASAEFPRLLAALDEVDVDSLPDLSVAGERIRAHLETLPVPEAVARDIVAAWQATGTDHAYAVRSSATAEDLPGASFAGQQDTFLNVSGERDILHHVRKCWASLFTDRAIAYRARNGFAHSQVFLSVIVQRMVLPEVSGIMFTADPVSGNRRIVAIDASFGLGEALVSGIVSADLYHIKGGEIVKKQVARKETAIYARAEGGTARVAITGSRQTAAALFDEQALALARLGRTVEAYFGTPQDIEWCIADDKVFIVQSRPITTLYPVPQVDDDQFHVFMSIGHPQMMTEAIKPLGISVLRTLVPFGKGAPGAESRLLREAGSRVYADLTRLLRYRLARRLLPVLLNNVDQSISRALGDILNRKEFAAVLPLEGKIGLGMAQKVFPTAFAILRNIVYRDNHQAIHTMDRFIADTVAANRAKLEGWAGPDRIVRIQEILSSLMPLVFSTVAQYMAAALITYKLIGSLSERWLGDTVELGSISKSPPGNVTSEMGLALGDVADAVRGYPAVVEYLEHADDSTFFDGLRAVPGGEAVIPVFAGFFERYGMRGTGEIDITRPRWNEAPTQLVPALLSNIKAFAPGQHRRDFLDGEREAEQAANRLLARLRATPGGVFKASRMKRLILVHRSLIGIREHPKYFLIQHFGIIKQAILAEAAELVAAGVLTHPEEAFWFSLSEFGEVIATRRVDRQLIESRREKFRHDAKLIPPRVISSEGEIITARPAVDVPPGALAGTPVSAGRVEGRARVIRSLAEAKMDKGDILIAPYTDPGWTPLFPLAAGLVTEVGGLMTHGAVVAREYGIPAVVGVDEATRKIADGQMIRVDGSQGIIEILK